MSEGRDYTLEFTPLAKALAERHHTIDEVKAEVFRDIEDIENVDELLFTTVAVGDMFDDSIPKFIVTHKGNKRNKVLLVDSADYEDHGKLEQGPFAGMNVLIPVKDGRSE